jgi:hypothetical protein
MARPAIDLGNNVKHSSDIKSNTAQKPSRVGAAISKSIHYIKALSPTQSGIAPCFGADTCRKKDLTFPFFPYEDEFLAVTPRI